jgi:DNA-binding response OmpR family regulator
MGPGPSGPSRFGSPGDRPIHAAGGSPRHRSLHAEDAVADRPAGPTTGAAPPPPRRLTGALHHDAGRYPGRFVVQAPCASSSSDEPQIAFVRNYQRRLLRLAADGASGLALARTRRPDAMILDLGLPSVDGLDVVRAVRRDSTMPIVILTARGDETDRVTGLELGADDYVVKPFSPKELVARVRAVLRRVDAASRPTDRLVVGDLEVDLARHRVTAAAASDADTYGFDLLRDDGAQPAVFAAASSSWLSRLQLETYERAIDGKNLRRKLEPDPSAPRYVRTVHGVGYAVEEPGRGT